MYIRSRREKLIKSLGSGNPLNWSLNPKRRVAIVIQVTSLISDSPMSIIHAIRTAVTIGMIVTLAIHPAFIVPSGYGDGLASKIDTASASCVACGCCQSKSPESLCCCCKAEEKPTDQTSKGDANQDVWVEVNQTAWAAECECGTMVPPRHRGQERSEQEVVRHSSPQVPDRIEYSFNVAVPSPIQAMLHGANSCLLNFSQCFLCRWLI